jgi:hypothetical protein
MFKTCPRCRDEFQAWVSECPDCRIPLVHAPSGGLVAPEPEPEPERGALADPRMLQRGDASELHALAEHLTSQGIACAIAAAPVSRASAGLRTVQLALFVEARELAGAQAATLAFLAPAHEEAGELRAPGALETCPGCDEPLAASAAQCPSCGLEFPEMEASS